MDEAKIWQALRDLNAKTTMDGAGVRRYVALHKLLREECGLPDKFTWLSPRRNDDLRE
jgi:hypothetical protein